ncbi:adenine phosphoribosyltransferase [Hyaloraphidium curvatum]|nr:adenine phosphoribosyltransferase [Hyaloraphidium curvatum]
MAVVPADVVYVQSKIRIIPDFPIKDIMPIFQDPLAVEAIITHFTHHLLVAGPKVDVIVGLDARGFLFGPILAQRLHCSFVPVRKKGKLPGDVIVYQYKKEYGVDEFEMQKDSVKPGQNVVVVDDLIATGGSAKGAGELVTQLGGKVIEYLFVVELVALKGAEALSAPVYSFIKSDD